jgi:hypothetical protein
MQALSATSAQFKNSDSGSSSQAKSRSVNISKPELQPNLDPVVREMVQYSNVLNKLELSVSTKLLSSAGSDPNTDVVTHKKWRKFVIDNPNSVKTKDDVLSHERFEFERSVSLRCNLL